MGPRGALENFGSKDVEGAAFNLRILRRMLSYLSPYRWQMVGAFLATILQTLVTLAIPYLTKVAIDQDISQGDLSGLARTALEIAVADGQAAIVVKGDLGSLRSSVSPEDAVYHGEVAVPE